MKETLKLQVEKKMATEAGQSEYWEMATFTCISCRVAFADADLQRGHYKTDWHRYNLKRKVADLPPVTAENFQQRVLAQRAQTAEQEKDTSTRCTLCNKHFGTKNAYENHLQSKKHKEAEVKQSQQIQAQVQKRNEKNEAKGMEVLQENQKVLKKDAANMALKEQLQSVSSKAPGSKSSAQAMTSTSSGSDAQNLKMFGKSTAGTQYRNTTQEPGSDDEDSDAESCESWEGEALGLEECLFCSQLSETLEENVKHMTSTHSFFIPDVEYLTELEGLISYLGAKVGEGHVCLWCNEHGKSFASTKAVQRHMVDKGHCKLLHEGDVLFEYADFYDYRSSYPDYDPNQTSDEGATSASSAAEGDEEEEVEPQLLDGEKYQLVLPSGCTVGHRSLMRYYRQNLVPQRKHNPTVLTRVMAHYRALGWTGTTGVNAIKKAKDIAYIQRIHSKHHMQAGVKANKLQAHFRCQVIF